MNIIQCQFCKKPFQSIGRKICPACLDQIDRDFVTVRDYIYEHKHTDIDTVVEDTEVSKQIILHLLKEGRLTLGDESENTGLLHCEVCRKPISSGRMCKDCQDKVKSKMQKNIESHSHSASRSDSANFKGSAKLKS